LIIKTWKEIFTCIKQKPYYASLNKFLDEEYKTKTIYPPREDIFNAFKLTSTENLKVVILGQDPYSNPGQAMGLSFSVQDYVTLPPSLRNIYKEMESEFDFKMDYSSGNLTYLAKQGVLLLNPILTVEAHKPLSHKCKDYNAMFLDIISELNNMDKPIVFLLWGGNAKRYAPLLTNDKHLVIMTAHPSPLSANQGGWFGSKCFIKTNKFLKDNNVEPINWQNK
jgi:uracil-DNA glycosylase